MISTKRATTIITEQDEINRNAMVNKLTKEDEKYLLKQCLSAMRGNDAQSKQE